MLVVDDSEVTRAILARTLRGAGFEVLEARDGVEGAVLALRERPAVVVTDLEMPTMDGFPLLRLLKADPASAHIPVLILTSHGEAASRFWSLRTGADAYLTKDYRPQRAGRPPSRGSRRRPPAAPRSAGAARRRRPPAGPLEVLARVARQLDASLLQATLVNTLLERGMAAADFHEASRVGAGDPRPRWWTPASWRWRWRSRRRRMVHILLRTRCRRATSRRPARGCSRRASSCRRARRSRSQVSGERRAATAAASTWSARSGCRSPLRGAAGVLALLPRDPQQFAAVDQRRWSTPWPGHLALVLDNARLSQRLHEMSTLDGLTRQLNHRAIYERLTEELERAPPLPACRSERGALRLRPLQGGQRHPRPPGGRRGAARGRRGAAPAACAPADLLGRYGGEEFLAVLPQVDLEAARLAAERLRRGLEEHAGAAARSGERGADHRLVRRGLPGRAGAAEHRRPPGLAGRPPALRGQGRRPQPRAALIRADLRCLRPQRCSSSSR